MLALTHNELAATYKWGLIEPQKKKPSWITKYIRPRDVKNGEDIQISTAVQKEYGEIFRVNLNSKQIAHIIFQLNKVVYIIMHNPL